MAGTLAIQDVLERFPEEQTPLVRELLRIIDQQRQKIERLEQEIRSLKGTQDTSPPPTEPSGLNETCPPSDRRGSKGRGKRGGKRPGSAKRSKTKDLTIHKSVPLTLTGLPEGTKFLGYENFTVQDLIIQSHNTLYRRGRYRLPDGSFRTAPLPEDVVGSGHFGPTLRQYVLYQHFHNHVTQPLLHEELLEFGVEISAGQISWLLTEGHDVFHQEKDGLLSAARDVSSYLQTDHTPARHRGESGQTLHIGNDLFASFSTIDSKSRVDFLKCLLVPHTEYVFDRAASVYLALFDVPRKLQEKLETAAVSVRVVESDEAWEQQLDDWEITLRRTETSGQRSGVVVRSAAARVVSGHGVHQRRRGRVSSTGVFPLAVLGASGTSHHASAAGDDPAAASPRPGAGRHLEVLSASEAVSGLTDSSGARPFGTGLRPVVPTEDRLANSEPGAAEDLRQT